jgi:hypothetical protein
MNGPADRVSRRRFAGLLGAATVGGLAGCVSGLGPLESEEETAKPVGLVIRTYFESQHTLDLAIDDPDSETSYHREFTLLPGDVVRRSSILEPGTYSIRVQVKDDMWQSAEWEMGDCPSDDIHIEVGEGGIGIGSTCHR